MKNLLLILICILSFCASNAQSNKEIANVYFKRAQESLDNLEVEKSLEHFTKAMKYTDTITSYKIARLGTYIHYELRNFKKAKKFVKQYFVLAKKKKTEEYEQLIELSVNITEEYEAQLEEEKRIEEERIKKEKELKRIDSLKTVWKNKSEMLSLKMDSIYSFDKNNLAIFKTNNSFGVINDIGEIILKSEDYKDALSFDGYILFLNKPKDPTKIYCFNRSTKEGFLIPNVSDFNSLSTHYGKVMLPRGNGRLVTYPNNSYQPLVYDLNSKTIVKIANQKELFKTLKKADIIDKYNKDGEVKINKIWYSFGGHIGGGIHPLYLDKNYNVHSFLCSIDGKVLYAASDYQYIGSFHNDKLQAIEGDNTVWINQNGTKVSEAKDSSGSYSGSSKVVKIENGVYQIMRDGIIILGNEKLEKMSNFLRNNSSK